MIADKDKSPNPINSSHLHPTAEAMGLVVVDVGNNHVAAASWLQGKRSEAVRLGHESAEAAAAQIKTLWDELPAKGPRAVIASSVCPPIWSKLATAMEKASIEPVLLVGHDIDLPIPADVPEPDKVGTDRICTAAAAFARIKQACVVADFGTALTIDLVADNNIFLGGTILPGIDMAARALHEQTAQLPLVSIEPTRQAMGKDTRSAINCGISAMMVGGLREVTERIATEIGRWPALVVTGGNAQSIAEACDFIDRIEPDLCLDGLVLAYENAVARMRPQDEEG